MSDIFAGGSRACHGRFRMRALSSPCCAGPRRWCATECEGPPPATGRASIRHQTGCGRQIRTGLALKSATGRGCAGEWRVEGWQSPGQKPSLAGRIEAHPQKRGAQKDAGSVRVQGSDRTASPRPRGRCHRLGTSRTCHRHTASAPAGSPVQRPTCRIDDSRLADKLPDHKVRRIGDDRGTGGCGTRLRKAAAESASIAAANRTFRPGDDSLMVASYARYARSAGQNFDPPPSRWPDQMGRADTYRGGRSMFGHREIPIRQACRARKTGAVRADFGRRMRLSMGVGKARLQRRAMAGSCAPRPA